MLIAAVPSMPIREAPETAVVLYTALMVAVTAGFFLWWLRSPAEHRIGPVLPLILAGGMLSGLMEAWLDNVVLVGYPPEQNLPAWEAYGRTVPIFTTIGYGWFCGGLLYVVARYLQKHEVTAKKIWTIFTATVVVDFVAIGLTSWIGILEFFGNPPMNIGGYPLWWGAFDGLDVILGGALVLVLLDHLRGRQQLWYLLVPSIALGAASGIVAWPISTAINSSWSGPAKFACALGTIGLSLACVRFIAAAMPRTVTLSRYAADHAAPAIAGEQVDARRLETV